MSDEAFPNADHLFQQAFAADDPVPPLLQPLNQHPTYAATIARILPRRVARIPTIEGETFSCLVNDVLADMHFKVIWGDSEIKEYGPTNTYLLDSLLSGLSLKHGLTSTNTQYGSIDRGLNAPTGSDKSEVLVVGTCIQLLLHGSEIVTDWAGSYRKKAKVAAEKLKAQEAAGTVKDPHATQLLKLAISHAETGLKAENDRDDVWALLFPSKS